MAKSAAADRSENQAKLEGPVIPANKDVPEMMDPEVHPVHLVLVATLVHAAPQEHRADPAGQVKKATKAKMASMVLRAHVATQDVPANQGDPASQDLKVIRALPELLANAEVRERKGLPVHPVLLVEWERLASPASE